MYRLLCYLIKCKCLPRLYRNFDTLIPDAPELIHSYLEGEQDASCKRNAFMMLIHVDRVGPVPPDILFCWLDSLLCAGTCSWLSHNLHWPSAWIQWHSSIGDCGAGLQGLPCQPNWACSVHTLHLQLAQFIVCCCSLRSCRDFSHPLLQSNSCEG